MCNIRFILTLSPWKPWFMKMFISILHCCTVCLCEREIIVCVIITTAQRISILTLTDSCDLEPWPLYNMYSSQSRTTLSCLSASLLPLDPLCWLIIEVYAVPLRLSALCLRLFLSVSLSPCRNCLPWPRISSFLTTSSYDPIFRHRLASLSVLLPIIFLP